MKLLAALSLVSLLTFTTAPDFPAKPEDISPLLIGESIPDVQVLGLNNQPVSLRAEVAKKPTILVFYRGGWCPFCNKQLAELRTLEPDLQKMGYQLVAISTDSPENLKATLDKQQLSYSLFSDADVMAAQAFGLAFKAPAPYAATLEKGSGGKNVEKLLPVPAVFLVNQSGVIKFEYINPNFKERISSKLLMAAAETMR
jgi:peroxiredoxin